MTRFEKISKAQFEKDWKVLYGANPDEHFYEEIKTPRRSTKYSAGYDFFLPFDIILGPGDSITVPTGIRAILDKNQFLMLAPRSGLGFKYRLQLDNTIGIIDSDYAHSSNEGHIMARITNDTNEYRICRLDAGDAFMQGIVMRYELMEQEEMPTKERDGGFGSTDHE